MMAHCAATFMNRPTHVLVRQVVDHAARAGSPKWGPHPPVWAHDSYAEEGQALPSVPTTGHGWCSYGLLMVPASSMHGGSHQARVAGATGACLHAWALRKSVSAQCTPTPRGCTACQGRGCEHGARAVHKHTVRWRKHSTRHQRLLPGGAPAPRPASHPMGWVLGLCTNAPQAAGCRLTAAAGNND